MPDNDTDSTAFVPPTPAPTPGAIPPIESSPEFQARTRAALGGNSDRPPTFGAIAGPGGFAGPSAARVPQPRRPHDPAYDGPSPDLLTARALVATLPPSLTGLRTALATHLEDAQDTVRAIKDDKTAKAEADMQGVDLGAVTKFLNLLAKAVSKDQ